MQVDQKRFSTKKPTQLVYLELGAGNGGMLTSVSEDGFRFRAVSPVRPNTHMQFAFSLDGSLRLEGNGIVEDLEDDCKSGGMRFTEVSEQFRASLRNWLQSDTSHQPTGREFTPAAATPLDTMDQIRHDLRAGYVKSTREPQAAPQADSNENLVPYPAPIQSRSQAVRSAVSPHDKDAVSKNELPEPATPPAPAPEVKPLAPTVPVRRPKPAALSLPKPEPPREPYPAKPHFTVTLPPEPKPQKPAPTTSAFLKPRVEVSAQPEPPAEPKGEPPRYFSAQESPLARPYIPPLEESFEQAWERARLTAPAESPHLSRAAAGGIIAIALVVILGALAFNFRQDIGSLVISLGRSISGESQPRTSDPSTQPSTSGVDSSPALSQPKTDLPSPADSAKSADANASSTQQNTSPASPNTEPKKNAASTTGSLQNSVPANSIPPAPSQLTAENSNKPLENPDSATGQDEFDLAKELLHGNNRQRDLPHAVDLLWAGVRKGYVPAEVTLADLFRRGDGVEKNCDQASVLLTAASKKGSVEARRMLELMAEQGCQ